MIHIRCQKGILYADDNASRWGLWCGRWQDAIESPEAVGVIEAMRRSSRAERTHIITDPPYSAVTHRGAARGMAIDFDPIDDAQIDEIVRRGLAIADGWLIAFTELEMLGAWRSAGVEFGGAKGSAYVRGGFWRKPDGAPQFTGDRPGIPGEAFAVLHSPHAKKRWNGGGHHAFYSIGVERGERWHPTQKPGRLMSKVVRDYTDPGDLVVDIFAGSGTTGVAALSAGRSFFGCELDEAYARDAIERIVDVCDSALAPMPLSLKQAGLL